MCPLFHIENTNNGGQWKDRGFIVYVFWLFFFFCNCFCGGGSQRADEGYTRCLTGESFSFCSLPSFLNMHNMSEASIWQPASLNSMQSQHTDWFQEKLRSFNILNVCLKSLISYMGHTAEVFVRFFFYFFISGTIFYPWGVLERLILAFQTSNLIPFFWPNVPLACSDCALPFYLNAYLWICHFSHLKGTGVFCFCFFFSGAILVVDPDQMTLSVITFLTSLCSELTLKHWFGEVRRHFWGFCPQKGTFYKC